jgi:hypothetical protein
MYACMFMHVYVHDGRLELVDLCTYMHSYICTFIHQYHTSSFIHTYIHTYIHAYTVCGTSRGI